MIWTFFPNMLDKFIPAEKRGLFFTKLISGGITAFFCFTLIFFWWAYAQAKTHTAKLEAQMREVEKIWIEIEDDVTNIEAEQLKKSILAEISPVMEDILSTQKAILDCLREPNEN